MVSEMNTERLRQIKEMGMKGKLSQTEVAKKFHVSRQYINSLIDTYRPEIGGLFTTAEDRKPKCKQCGKTLETQTVYCSDECKKIQHNVKLTCHVCGVTFYVRKTDFKRREKLRKIEKGVYFHNKTCFGKYLANRCGFKKGVKRNANNSVQV